MPFSISLALWDALNALLLFFAVEQAAAAPARQRSRSRSIYLEVLRTMQRSQSNSLVTALVILAFIAFEQRQQLGAAFSIAVGAAVKIFPLAALALAIFYPRRMRFALLMVLAMAMVLALPLLVVDASRARGAVPVMARGGGGRTRSPWAVAAAAAYTVG